MPQYLAQLDMCHRAIGARWQGTARVKWFLPALKYLPVSYVFGRLGAGLTDDDPVQ